MASREEGTGTRSGGRPIGALESGAGALAAAWLAGQLAKDATLATGWLFYLPSLVVAGALMLSGLAARCVGKRAAPLLVLSLPPLVVGLVVEHRWLPRPAPPSVAAAPLRLLHWNVSGGWAGLDEIAAEIALRRPDLVVLSEAPERVARRVAVELPGFEGRALGGISVLATRVDELQWVERDRRLQVVSAEVPWGAGRIRLLAVNLASSPWVPRHPSLERVRAAIVALTPDLVVGDFNAPRRSRVLSHLPSDYRHAYDVAGWGWSASWPVPIPLLSLDHVIVGRRLNARGYRLEATRWSDHRLQLAELEVGRSGS